MEEVNSKLWIHWMEKPSRVNLSIIHNIASSEKLLHIMIITPVKDRTAYGRRRGFLHCICYLKTVKNVFLLKLTWITVWKTENHSDELINCTVNPGLRISLRWYEETSALNAFNIISSPYNIDTHFCIHLFLDCITYWVASKWFICFDSSLE